MTYWQMYLITRLDTILTFAGIFTVLSAATLLIVLVACANHQEGLKNQLYRAKKGDWDVPDAVEIERDLEENEALAKKSSIWLLLIFLACISLLLFLPSEKSMYKIIIVPKIVNNETIRNDYRELYDLAVDALKEKLKGDRR